jgi:Carboxypeptidase regulatory-like domain
METVADADGRYEFAGLEAGEYGVSAGPGELRATHLRQAFGQPTPGSAPSSWARSGVEIKTGEVRSGIDITLARALAIEGRVLDPWEQPMANVAVEVTRADGVPDSTNPAHSDDRGEFRVYGLSPGRYHVCATPQARSIPSSTDSSRFVRTCHPASLKTANAADVIVTTKDALGVEIRVQRSGTFSLSGSVFDAAGEPADGVRIGANEFEDRSVSSAAVSSGGQFILRGLTPGRYVVTATLGGPASPGDKRPPAREREFGHALVDVGGSGVTGLTLALSRGMRITGRVTFDGSSPPSPSGLRMVVHTGILGASILSMISGRPPFSAVDDRLQFELTGVHRLPLIVGMSGLPDGWLLRSVRLGERDITNLPTDFGSMPEPRRIEIVVTNRVARPAVRVTDDQGRPVTSYRLSLLPADPARWDGWIARNSSVPDRDGLIKLDPIVPGDYLLAALTPDDYSLVDALRFPDRPLKRIRDLAAVSTRITFREGDGQTVDLRMTTLPAIRQ